jgi:hypothetical protein
MQLQIIRIQEERARNYHSFNSAFKSYLESKDVEAFNQTVRSATESMQSLSSQAREVEAGLTEEGQAELAQLVRCIQDNERVKLQLTLTLQKLQQAEKWQTFSWQQPVDPDEDILEPKKGCGCLHPHNEGEPHVPEPTELEFHNALKEATLMMDETNCKINEAIEEIRETLEG